jgi:hypothetical protein
MKNAYKTKMTNSRGMCRNSILFYTNITYHAYGVQHLTPSTYTLCQTCWIQLTERKVFNTFAH